MVKKEFTKMISSSEDDRLRLKIETKKGKVVDIVVQYEAKFDEEWHPIVRLFFNSCSGVPLRKSLYTLNRSLEIFKTWCHRFC